MNSHKEYVNELNIMKPKHNIGIIDNTENTLEENISNNLQELEESNGDVRPIRLGMPPAPQTSLMNPPINAPPSLTIGNPPKRPVPPPMMMGPGGANRKHYLKNRIVPLK